MADVPHERSLVKRLEGKPFVLLGVNSDKDRQAAKDVTAKEAITWRSWWDGGGTEGPIAKKWNIHAWPTLYLLDSEGTIRFKGEVLRGVTLRKGKDGALQEVRLLDEAIDELMKEVNRQK